MKWDGLNYEDLSEEYFIDILPFISEIEQYNRIQKNSNRIQNQSVINHIEKPIELCNELKEYQKYDIMKLIWMYENNINISFLLYIIIFFNFFVKYCLL